MRDVNLRDVDLNLLHALDALLSERHVTRAGYVRCSEISSSFALGAPTSARCGANACCASWNR